MTPPARHEVTRLLGDWSRGNRGALDALMPLVYAELHAVARRYLARERPGHTLQPTALVNEAYLRLAGERGMYFGGLTLEERPKRSRFPSPPVTRDWRLTKAWLRRELSSSDCRSPC